LNVGCGGYIKDEGLIEYKTEENSECWWYIETSGKNHTIQLENIEADEFYYSLKVIGFELFNPIHCF
jgi:hypothetical protein